MAAAANQSTSFNNFLDSIKDLAIDNGANTKPLPPVELWNPQNCGDIGMEIRRDGSWWHENIRISRPNLCKLFSRILRKDMDGQTYLVTPYEKIIVKVEDAHFLITRLDFHGSGQSQTIAATTNVDEVVIIGEQNPLWVNINPQTREPRPYLRVRGRLDALILRPPFYELVEKSVHIGDEIGIYSQNCYFKLDDAD